MYKATIDAVDNTEEKEFIALQTLECYLGMMLNLKNLILFSYQIVSLKFVINSNSFL